MDFKTRQDHYLKVDDSLNSVIEFAGKDYENAVVPDKARKILIRFDK